MPGPEARTRFRRNSLRFDKKTISNRISCFYTDDIRNHDESRALRLQRYAKLRMWTEGKDYPWEGASDFAPPDMMEASLRTQDTLHNAVMQQSPPVVSRALHEQDKDKQQTIDDLQHYQFFVEQCGETIVGEFAQAFVDAGEAVAFIPWVTEMAEVSSVQRFDPMPDDKFPVEYFGQTVQNAFPQFSAASNDGWDWILTHAEDDSIPPKQVKFYTQKGSNKTEMVVFEQVEVYNGPRVLPKSFDQVLHPARCTNLQGPGPSNPGGASHVILIDFPSIDEIRRLRKEKIYDLVTDEEMDRMEATARTNLEDEANEQKDTFAGQVDEPQTRPDVRGHDTMTRLMVFDRYDIDGDGIEEDIVWWMIKEGDVMLRAKRMSEIFPSSPPKRPLAEAVFLPVEGRRNGISLLELVESTHDQTKIHFDQMVDNGTLTTVPFFFYRPTGNIKPELIRIEPGNGIPLSDPTRDVYFPRMDNSQSMSFGMNMISLLKQEHERLVVQGDLQFGRIPAGKATALRTTRNLENVLAQGEARPQRILRRFFTLLSEIWAQMHERNKHFLPKNKQYRILGVRRPSEDPFVTIEDSQAIQGRFDFTFEASVFNTSAEALQQALDEALGLLINPVMIQLGIVKPDNVYRLVRDWLKSRGQPSDQYASEPSPGAAGPFIFAEQALTQILNGNKPVGTPSEPGGAIEHLQKLMAEMQKLIDPNEESSELTPAQGRLLREYLQQVQQQAVAQQEQAQLQQAAGQFRLGGPQDPGGAPSTTPPPDLSNPQVQPNELLDETLPGA